MNNPKPEEKFEVTVTVTYIYDPSAEKRCHLTCGRGEIKGGDKDYTETLQGMLMFAAGSGVTNAFGGRAEDNDDDYDEED